MAKGIPFPFGKFRNKRSFLYIENLCYVIKLLLEKSIPSGVYNVVDDTPISTNSLVKLIGESHNKKTRILNIPKFIIKGIAVLGNFLPLPINSEKLNKLTDDFVISN